MDNKKWLNRDEKFWTLLLGVLEAGIVYGITNLSGTCNFMNVTLMPCWSWGLIVWTVSMIVTYYIGVKGSFWLFPKVIEIVRQRYYQYKIGRNARLMMLSFNVENKYYVSVHNEEFWFRADDVMIKSMFQNMAGVNVDKNTKWRDTEVSSISIPRKKHKVFHIATVSEGKLIVHLIGGDEIFPFPNTIIPYYVIPLITSGSVSFLNRKVKKIRIAVNESIYIYNDGKSEMRWQKDIRTR